MKVKLKGKTQSGFGIIEILISLLVITSAITGMLLITGQRGGGANQVVGDNQRTALDTDTANRGIYRALEMLEKDQVWAVNKFNSIVSSSSVDGIFTDKVIVTDISPCRKDIISSVNWALPSNRTQTVQLSSSLAGMQEAAAMGGDCNITPPSTSWQNITCKNSDGSPTWDFSPSGIPPAAIDLIKRGANTYAVITGKGSSGGQKDFWVVNVTNRATLGAVGSIETGPGLNDVDVAGNYAFAVSNATSKQLRVIDVSTLTAPIEVMTASRSLTSVGAGSEGQKIFYYNNKVYIGTNYMVAYDEFQIFDVTNPLNPSATPIGKYNVNHNIYSIIIRNQNVGGVAKTLAYLTVSASDPTKPKLLVLDVTNPTTITKIGSFNPVPNDTRYGTALYISGNKAYLGRQRGTGSNYDLFSLNISDPSSIYASDPDSALLGMSAGNDVRGLIASGPLLFVSNSDNNVGFQVWNIADPANIFNIKNCKYPQEPAEIEFDGNYIYVVNRSNDALRIIYDSSNPFP